MQSLCGIAHYDYNLAGEYGYEEAFEVMIERSVRVSSQNQPGVKGLRTGYSGRRANFLTVDVQNGIAIGLVVCYGDMRKAAQVLCRCNKPS